MAELQTEVLQKLDASPDATLTSENDFPALPFTTLKAALDSLGSKEMITYETRETDYNILTAEGQQILETGSHEAKVWEIVHRLGEFRIADLAKQDAFASDPSSAKVGQARAFKEGWIKKHPEDKTKIISGADSINDVTRNLLETISQSGSLSDTATVADLKKRKLIIAQKKVAFTIHKGTKFALEILKEYTDLDADMLASGKWQELTFKPYNLKALGAPAMAGALHPLGKVRHEFRQIFFEMGFTEMPTNQFVESGFWNFDALYVPQQHPARDVQDTFFISDPAKADMPRNENGELLTEYWDNVKQVHETGKFGSLGYRYPWQGDESLKLVLRTHTTATSAAMLYKLAQDPRPARYFSIDRVFRNETVDATHLAEFHQVEGVIADFDLTLGDLIGFMNEFFGKMGVKQLRFKPAYNPYTEPSMEIFSWHEGLGKWVEIGNSGMFRPEMLESMGLPKGMKVHGWGLSLERPTMIKYGVSNIRELLGHKVDLNFIEGNPAVRLDQEA
ncbi:Phenylalanyl-tRNA synthetase, beta subunit, cytoplasmic [Orbilia oligospora]|uniref:phenylalanine--tRNA ligase n=1 Tax=Orbilia oligospora TaxID=2813651 RepID=A0A6G1MGQ5_ORBOL|nr:Phenylalanyl-tRNA synthetase, beta subunit, cytoplasmic [Orbilia oligospora]KAF3225558.1 Phenylalanyl-tRNA synthetase, beta subunit, cytoplasmic [Orbilia oligospora]KAF3255380.1 Phenylalanyl-tRNA synthetase, beta subunit, cytoplasmic [Orbilia oligospora]